MDKSTKEKRDVWDLDVTLRSTYRVIYNEDVTADEARQKFIDDDIADIADVRDDTIIAINGVA